MCSAKAMGFRNIPFAGLSFLVVEGELRRCVVLKRRSCQAHRRGSIVSRSLVSETIHIAAICARCFGSVCANKLGIRVTIMLAPMYNYSFNLRYRILLTVFYMVDFPYYRFPQHSERD